MDWLLLWHSSTIWQVIHPWSIVYDPKYLTTIGFHLFFFFFSLDPKGFYRLLLWLLWWLLYKNIICKWKRWHRLNKTDAFRFMCQIFLSCFRSFRFLLCGLAMEGECFVSKQINLFFEIVFLFSFFRLLLHPFDSYV